MNYRSLAPTNVASILVCMLGCIGLAAVLGYDQFFSGIDPLQESWPDFSQEHLIRSLAIFITMLCFVLGLLGKRRPEFKLDSGNTSQLEVLSIMGIASASALFVILFLNNPSLFRALCMEDRPVEWGSFVLLIASSTVCAISFFKSRHLAQSSKLLQLSFLGLAFIFFLIAMEEVSWFQRQLGIATPEAFAENIQGEMNLHNFATELIENMYYFGAFVFLVLLPFSRLVFPFISNNSYLQVIVARPFIALIGAFPCAYNFDMWNIIFSQVAFFGSVLILFIYMLFSEGRKEGYLTSAVLIMILLTQFLFLAYGENFRRLWDVTEYKELLIPAAFFVYTLDVFKQHFQSAAKTKESIAA